MTRIFAIVALFSMLAFSSLPASAAWAVAMAPGGQPIVARGFVNVRQAKDAALRDCQKVSGRGCDIVESANLSCVAMAVAGESWGIGKGQRKAVAHTEALAQCTAQKAGTCKVVHEFCG